MDNIKKKIKKEYEEGATLKKLSEKYGVKLNTVKSWSSREEWKKKQKVATKDATEEKKLQPKKGNEQKKREAYKEIIEGATLEKIEQKIGVPKSTVSTWATKYKWQVEKELLLNESLQKIREKVFGDKKKEIENLILWVKKELESIKTLVENAVNEDVYFINSKFSMIDKYMKMQFKLLGIRYTGELTELVRVANQIEVDEKKHELEKQKLNIEEKRDTEIIFKMKEEREKLEIEEVTDGKETE